MGAPAQPRKKSPPTKGLGKIPAASEALKKCWQDPAFRERMKVAAEKRKLNKNYRGRVPDGMRKAEAEVLWDVAKKKAEWLMSEFEKDGLVDAVVVPDSDDGKAKAALHETCVIALGPGNAQTKLAALKTVLDFTKVKPVTKIDQKISSAEAFLADALADMKNEPKAS